MQVEFVLRKFQQVLVGLVQRKPDKGILALQRLADFLDPDLTLAPAFEVGDAISDHARVVLAAGQGGLLYLGWKIKSAQPSIGREIQACLIRNK
jgi:hypothetical protein